MLITDSEKARADFYSELTAAAKGTSPESIGTAAAKFEHSVVKRTEAEIGIKFKKGLIVAITVIFMVSVVAMWIALYLIFSTEVDLLRGKVISASDRIIDSKVAMTLIGATVVQIGVAFGLIANSLFSSTAVTP
jgi:hypothetical protein